jgi:hypothetical protein
VDQRGQLPCCDSNFNSECTNEPTCVGYCGETRFNLNCECTYQACILESGDYPCCSGYLEECATCQGKCGSPNLGRKRKTGIHIDAFIGDCSCDIDCLPPMHSTSESPILPSMVCCPDFRELCLNETCEGKCGIVDLELGCACTVRKHQVFFF